VGFCFGIRRAVGRASTSGVQSPRSAGTRVLTASGSAALAEHGTTGLSAVVASVLLACTPLLSLDTVISGTSLRANQLIAEASRELPPQPTWPLSNSRNLLATDPTAFVQFLKTVRPEPVSAENKARALSSLPEEGEVTNLNASARQKLSALVDVLRATDRDSVYEIKVIAVPQAAVVLHARAIQRRCFLVRQLELAERLSHRAIASSARSPAASADLAQRAPVCADVHVATAPVNARRSATVG
jgi:hypothetical protein